MSILIGADFVPTKSNYELFESGNVTELVGEELIKEFASVDYRLFNFEVPLTDSGTPIIKSGPSLKAPKATISGYKALNINVATLANNHILDQGEQGLCDTLKVLKENSIAHVGAGKNLAESKDAYVIQHKGMSVAVYSCAEHEFSIATDNAAGANPYDPLESFDAVEELKSVHDFVIVLYHGGKEYYRYPSPELQRRCRKFVEKGADLVVCQHSHCIGCEEKYHSGTIVYGQGNFLFDDSDDECWRTGLLIRINDNFSITYIPVIKQDNLVRKADREKAAEIIEAFDKRSLEIQTDGFIQRKYEELADTMLPYYLAQFRGIRGSNIVYRVLNKLTHKKWRNFYVGKKYGSGQKTTILNNIQCEAHQELILAGLRKRR